MKYQCDVCHQKFMMPGRITTTSDVRLAQNTTSEVPTCPFCFSASFNEYVEPQQEISSVKSVDLAQVDDYLKLGYVVRELYAKTATLVKLEVKA